MARNDVSSLKKKRKNKNRSFDSIKLSFLKKKKGREDMSKIEGISAFCSPLEKSREEENSFWIYSSSSSSSSFSFLSLGVRRVLPVPIEKELASNRRANFDRRDTCYNTFLRRFGNSRFRNEGVTRLSRKRTRE